MKEYFLLAKKEFEKRKNQIPSNKGKLSGLSKQIESFEIAFKDLDFV